MRMLQATFRSAVSACWLYSRSTLLCVWDCQGQDGSFHVPQPPRCTCKCLKPDLSFLQHSLAKELHLCTVDTLRCAHVHLFASACRSTACTSNVCQGCS